MQSKQKKGTSKFVPPQKQIPTQYFFDKITQSCATSLGFPLFLHLIATALKFLYLIAISHRIIGRAKNILFIPDFPVILKTLFIWPLAGNVSYNM